MEKERDDDISKIARELGEYIVQVVDFMINKRLAALSDGTLSTLYNEKKELIVGAEEISRALFGTDNKKEVRRVYTMSESGAIPTFKLGGRIAITRATLDRFLFEQGGGRHGRD